MSSSRRALLRSAAGLAGGLTVSRIPQKADSATGALPTVRFGGWEITRLVCGANPFHGYSHFNRLLDAHMREWMTQERAVEILGRCERNGINTWQVHYYMACFYRVSRTHEEPVKELGEAPLGETFLERDPDRMTAVVRRTRKPCLGFKVLAAGRKTSRPEQVATAFDYAYGNIKPSDAVIVGMYPRYRDKVQENAGHVRRIHQTLS